MHGFSSRLIGSITPARPPAPSISAERFSVSIDASCCLWAEALSIRLPDSRMICPHRNRWAIGIRLFSSERNASPPDGSAKPSVMPAIASTEIPNASMRPRSRRSSSPDHFLNSFTSSTWRYPASATRSRFSSKLPRLLSVHIITENCGPAPPVSCCSRSTMPLDSSAGVASAAVIILASITDGLDGFLARRRHQITTMGMLLDPLADKLMVSAAYIVLVAYNPRIVPPWIAVLVIGREFLVSGLRSIAATEGFTIEASEIGKLKTVIQIVSVVAAILAHRWDYWNWGGFIVAVHFIAITAIYWMTAVSIISAVDYFVGFWKKIDHASDKSRRRRSFVLSRKQKPTPPAEHPSRIS